MDSQSGHYPYVLWVTAKNGAVQFFAVDWGGKVWQSSDGSAWTAAGTGFPASDVGRIALAVQQLSPDVVYAFGANSKGAVKGVYRMDGGGGSWKEDHGRTLPTRRMCCRLIKMEAVRGITIWLSRLIQRMPT
jgi:hypothetical protein